MLRTAWYAPETSTRFHGLRSSIYLLLFGLDYTAIEINIASLNITNVGIRQTINVI